MSSTALDIKIVYSARAGRKPRRAGRPTSNAAVTRPAWRWAALGLVNLVVACVVYYATWWRVDPFLYMTAMWKAPLPGVDAEEAAALLGLGPAPGRTQPPRVRTPRNLSAGEANQPAQPSAAATTPGAILAASADAPKRNAVLFGAALYGWLSISTISYSLLAVAAGASLARAGAGIWRRKWVILLLGAVAGMAYAAFDLLGRFGWQFPPDNLRWFWGGLVVLSVLAGLVVQRWYRGLNRVAALGLIAAAAGSVAGLMALKECNALEKAEYASLASLSMVFAVHSFYGWLLLPISARIGRS
jgi:hypothetical protein